MDTNSKKLMNKFGLGLNHIDYCQDVIKKLTEKIRRDEDLPHIIYNSKMRVKDFNLITLEEYVKKAELFANQSTIALTINKVDAEA